MQDLSSLRLYERVLDLLPTPVLIKDSNLKYLFINQAFEALFQVSRDDVLGRLDVDVFKERQAVQCNGGDLRVLSTGENDEAYETVFDQNSNPREVLTRKSRLVLPGGDTYLLGIIHDITEVSRINSELVEKQTELTVQSSILEKMAHTDPLTGCKNRRCLDTYLPKLFEKHDHTGGLIILDIDHFKSINDSYGHSTGDAVLKKVVKTVFDVLEPENEVIRMGGEEFAITSPGVSLERVYALAEKLRNLIAGINFKTGVEALKITASFGISYTNGSDQWDLDRLINQADKALYLAKDSGRNQVKVFR